MPQCKEHKVGTISKGFQKPHFVIKKKLFNHSTITGDSSLLLTCGLWYILGCILLRRQDMVLAKLVIDFPV